MAAAASAWKSSLGCEIQLKICSGRAVKAESRPVGLKATNVAAPTRISGAVSPIARESDRMMPVAMPGIDDGQDLPPDRLPLRRAEGERALLDRRRDGADRLARGDDHDRAARRARASARRRAPCGPSSSGPRTMYARPRMP